MSTHDPTTTRSILVLSLIGSFGLNSMYGLVYRNGYIDALLRLRDHGPHVLPGSNIPILKRFTGIGLLDKALVLAGVMFANVTDGSTPQLSLYGFQFAGQLVPMFTVMMIEAARRGNKGNIMSLSVLWGCASQGVGYGFTMPIYAIVHLLSSPTTASRDPGIAQNIRPQFAEELDSLIPSMILGYVIPSVLMAIPFTSPILHQWLGAFWQGYPVWVTIIRYGIRFVRFRTSDEYKERKSASATIKKSRATSSRVHEAMVLHKAYLFAFGFSATTNIITYAILATCKLCPALFSAHVLRTLTFRSVFLPPPFWSGSPMPNMATGILNFFQYDQYVGSTAAIIWAATLWVKARKEAMLLKDWVWLAGEIFGISIIAGPGAAFVSLLWNRDELILGEDELFAIEDQIDVQDANLIEIEGEDPGR